MKFLSASAFVLLMLAVGPLGATESKPFTPALMLQNESIGEVRFSPDGRQVFLEKRLAYREKRKFDRLRDWNRSLSILSSIDVVTGKARDLRISSQDRTWYLGSSPKGE